MARVAMARLDLTSTDTDVVLGGGILAAAIGCSPAGRGPPQAGGPGGAAPLCGGAAGRGAALLGLDRLGFGMAAQSRLRNSYLDRDTV